MRPSEALAAHLDEVKAILARYPVSNPRVFGSVARGEDVEGSDLDLLVDRNGTMSFSDIFALEDDIGKILDCPVEVFTGLKPFALEHALKDMRSL